MDTKQQFATGFLAMVIVGTIALMPVNAEVRHSKASVASSGTMVAALNTEELAQDQVKDLTYN